MYYLNIYRTARELGGPQEGGWYYTAYHPEESYTLADDMGDEQIEETASVIAYTLAAPFVAIVETDPAKYWDDYSEWS